MLPRLSILGRAWCHLCHDMVAAVQKCVDLSTVSIEEVDIDAFPLLEERWDELIPVLCVNDVYVCHYYLDESALRAVVSPECFLEHK